MKGASGFHVGINYYRAMTGVILGLGGFSQGFFKGSFQGSLSGLVLRDVCKKVELRSPAKNKRRSFGIQVGLGRLRGIQTFCVVVRISGFSYFVSGALGLCIYTSFGLLLIVLVCRSDLGLFGVSGFGVEWLLSIPLFLLLLMIEILHYLKDPKLWELWYIPCYG